MYLFQLSVLIPPLSSLCSLRSLWLTSFRFPNFNFQLFFCGEVGFKTGRRDVGVPGAERLLERFFSKGRRPGFESVRSDPWFEGCGLRPIVQAGASVPSYSGGVAASMGVSYPSIFVQFSAFR